MKENEKGGWKHRKRSMKGAKKRGEIDVLIGMAVLIL
jgi:hypothetical protein